DELGQAFNFEYLQAPWDADALRKVITDSLATARGAGASATWVLSNHDVVRHASRLMLPPGTDENAWLLSGGHAPAVDPEAGLRRARAATQLMLALPGSAYVYQGEELGLPEVADLPTEVLQDPVWEQTGRVRKGRDGCRVPLPWTRTGPSYGFGASGSWLPQPPGFAAYSVEAQDGVEGSTLEFYRAALRLRRKLTTDETLTWAPDTPPGVLQFDRSEGWRCVTNLSDAPVDLPAGEVLLTSAPLEDGRLGPDTTAWPRICGDAVTVPAAPHRGAAGTGGSGDGRVHPGRLRMAVGPQQRGEVPLRTEQGVRRDPDARLARHARQGHGPPGDQAAGLAVPAPRAGRRVLGDVRGGHDGVVPVEVLPLVPVTVQIALDVVVHAPAVPARTAGECHAFDGEFGDHVGTPPEPAEPSSTLPPGPAPPPHLPAPGPHRPAAPATRTVQHSASPAGTARQNRSQVGRTCPTPHGAARGRRPGHDVRQGAGRHDEQDQQASRRGTRRGRDGRGRLAVRRAARRGRRADPRRAGTGPVGRGDLGAVSQQIAVTTPAG